MFLRSVILTHAPFLVFAFPFPHLIFVLLSAFHELELELILTQMTQKPMLRAEVGMRVRCANKASAELLVRGRGIGQNYCKIVIREVFVSSAHLAVQ